MSEPPVTIFKYHGTGNDFVIIDTPSPLDAAGLAPQLCDRHRGIGADGVILVERDVPGFDARMVIYNQDGSRPQMCGNGIRCVARHLVETHGLATELRVATDAGERRCVVYPGDAFEVDVDMGVPRGGEDVRWGEHGNWLLHPVDMGNPHAVVFAPVIPTLAVVDEVGGELNAAGSPFDDGVNVEFTTVMDDRLDVVVYERGVGRTQACGTGACAAAVAAWATGRAPHGPLNVWLPGGLLRIRIEGDHVWMRGEAEFVLKGQLGAGWLRARTQ